MNQIIKSIYLLVFTIVSLSLGFSAEARDDWMTYYYKSPSPDLFSKELRLLTDKGLLANENAQAPIIAFLSQVMSLNAKRIPEWIEEFSNIDEKQRKVLLAAAWYSDTEEARELFKTKNLDAYLKQKAPKILEVEVNNPSALDMLWGYFFATGDSTPIRRIVTALSLSKYAGALDRFKTSDKTAKDRNEAYLDVTFQAARWSLESNCKAHPLVLEYCEKIFADDSTPKDQSLWLGVILSKVKPERYSIGFEKDNSQQNGGK